MIDISYEYISKYIYICINSLYYQLYLQLYVLYIIVARHIYGYKYVFDGDAKMNGEHTYHNEV